MFQVFDCFASQVPHKSAVGALGMATYALGGDACCEAYRALLVSDDVSTGEFVPSLSGLVRWGGVVPQERQGRMDEWQIVYEVTGRFAYFWDEDFELSVLFGHPPDQIDRHLIARGRAEFLKITAEQEMLGIKAQWLANWRKLDRKGMMLVSPQPSTK
jgi:hypothetical protein